VSILVRPIQLTDRAQWAMVWADYLRFYETSVAPEIYDHLFAKLTSRDASEFQAFVAVVGDEIVGLAHYLFHRSAWQVQDICYLQDLFTAPNHRGKGIAAALINAVDQAAKAGGTSGVYWMTHETNTPAQSLYNKVAQRSGFIEYVKAQA